MLDAADQRLAGMFAGAYPVDPFAEVDTVDGQFGPVISGTRTSLVAASSDLRSWASRCSCEEASRRSKSSSMLDNLSSVIEAATASSHQSPEVSGGHPAVSGPARSMVIRNRTRRSRSIAARYSFQSGCSPATWR